MNPFAMHGGSVQGALCERMRLRLLLFAALGLGLSCILAGVLLGRTPAPPEPPALAFPALAGRIATADRVELVHAGHVLWLERRGQVWGLARQGGYPARPGLADALMGALLSLRLMSPAPGSPASLGLDDPFGVGDESGTFVRVLGTSGATLCAVIVGPVGGTVIRRPGDEQAWHVNTAVSAPPDAESWSQQILPPLDPAQPPTVVDGGGLDAPTVIKALAAGLAFTDVRPAPQSHPTTARVIELGLATGTAVLTVGMEDGTPWLRVSGTSAWAIQLAPFSFALPETSPLAAL